MEHMKQNDFTLLHVNEIPFKMNLDVTEMNDEVKKHLRISFLFVLQYQDGNEASAICIVLWCVCFLGDSNVLEGGATLVFKSKTWDEMPHDEESVRQSDFAKKAIGYALPFINGIMFTRTQGTKLEGLFLPVIDASELAENIKVEKIEKNRKSRHRVRLLSECMLKILINAYACSPGMGSEPGMAWNWVSNLAKFCELFIITEGEFREKIEAVMTDLPEAKNMHFYYNPVSEEIRKMCWNQGDWRFYKYYREWQWKTYLMAKEICLHEKIDVLHQLNMIGFREPGYLWNLSKESGVPFVWGPIGGLKQFPTAYLQGAGLKNEAF